MNLNLNFNLKNVKWFQLAVMSGVMLSVSACGSSSKNQALDYQVANKKVVSLEVPPDLRDPRNGDLYSLPQGMTANPDALKSSSTHGDNRSRVLNPVRNAQIQSSGNQRWLHIGDRSAAEIWALTRAFWQDAGFTIASEEPNAGLMETEWAENRAKLPNQGLRKLFETVGVGGLYSTGERDKFMIRMENSNAGGLNIFFTHKGLEEVYDSKNKDRTVWQPRAQDTNLEAAFLSRFMQYLGADETHDTQAQNQSSNTSTSNNYSNSNNVNQTEFAQLENDSVVVFGQAERNVTRIGSALERVGFTIENYISERGMFVVRPVENESESVRDEKKSSWFSRLRGKKKTENAEESDNKKPEMFVFLEQTNLGQRVHLLNQAGQPYTGDDKKSLLNKIYQELK